MLHLQEKDLALGRRLYAIGPYIERMAAEGLVLKAQSIFWSSGEDVVKAVEEKLSDPDM